MMRLYWPHCSRVQVRRSSDRTTSVVSVGRAAGDGQAKSVCKYSEISIPSPFNFSIGELLRRTDAGCIMKSWS